MSPAEQAYRTRLIAIALMVGACMLFCFLDTTAKVLIGHMHILQVLWARCVIALLLGFAVSNPIRHPQLMRTTRPWLQVGRSALLVGSTVLNFLALRYLQLDQTVSIVFSTPFMVAALGGPLLGEWLRWRRWTAIIVGFSGVLLVTRPGAGGIHPAALFSFGCAACYAFYVITTRVLSRTDSDETTLFYTNMVGAVLTTAALPFVWTTPDSPRVVVLMFAVGLFGGLGHYLLIVAHRLAPAGVLSPFMYTQIVWMIALGYLVFGDVPSRWTLAGAAVVIASGLYLLYRERVVKGEL